MATAAPAYFPYPHRTMAEVMRQEELDAFNRRPRPEKGLTLKEWRTRT